AGIVPVGGVMELHQPVAEDVGLPLGQASYPGQSQGIRLQASWRTLQDPQRNRVRIRGQRFRIGEPDRYSDLIEQMSDRRLGGLLDYGRRTAGLGNVDGDVEFAPRGLNMVCHVPS